MSIHNELRAAESQGILLEFVAEVPWDSIGELAEALSELHNSDEIDLLDVLSEDRLDTLEELVFFRVRHAFNQTLPFIECGAEEAISTCRLMAKKAGSDITKGQEYDALEQWLQKSRQRVDDTIAWVESAVEVDPNILLLALVAGAHLAPAEFSELALAYSRRDDPSFRLSALSALGSIGRKLDVAMLDTLLERFEEAIGERQSDQEVATSFARALRLLAHFGEPILEQIERMHLMACENPGPITRYEIANHITPVSNLQNYSESMIDAAFNTMAYADKSELGTIEQIDLALYHWDLDEDRQRVIELLKVLLTRSDDSIGIGSLDNFKHRLLEQGGALIGWYAVSLLLTGDPRLCRAANDLLPMVDPPEGIGIDLTPFALHGPWIEFLARKILGYCLVNKKCAFALVLACLRAAPEKSLSALEELVFKYLLVNFPGAIDLMNSLLDLDDAAESSVSRLAKKIAQYRENLEKLPPCPAFKPSARHVQLQAYRDQDKFGEMWKEVEKNSVMSSLIPTSTVLFGSGVVSYLPAEESGELVRKEIALQTFRQDIELPRLQTLNPVGMVYAMYELMSESPPL